MLFSSQRDAISALLILRQLHDGEAIDYPVPPSLPQAPLFATLEQQGYIERWDRFWPLSDRYRLTPRGAQAIKSCYQPAGAEAVMKKLRDRRLAPAARPEGLRAMGFDPSLWPILHDPSTDWRFWPEQIGPFQRYVWEASLTPRPAQRQAPPPARPAPPARPGARPARPAPRQAPPPPRAPAAAPRPAAGVQPPLRPLEQQHHHHQEHRHSSYGSSTLWPFVAHSSYEAHHGPHDASPGWPQGDAYTGGGGESGGGGASAGWGDEAGPGGAGGGWGDDGGAGQGGGYETDNLDSGGGGDSGGGSYGDAS